MFVVLEVAWLQGQPSAGLVLIGWWCLYCRSVVLGFVWFWPALRWLM